MSALHTLTRRTAVALALGAAAAGPFAQTALTPEAARKVVGPFYDMLNTPASKDLKALADASLAPQWRSYSSETVFKTRDEVLATFAGFGKLVPDLSWEMKEVLVAGDRIVVRGEARGTPAGANFFGATPTPGKAFNIMSIDVHTVRDGKVVATYHVEDWATSLRQVTAK
jgi:predicted ester cyclase